MKKRKTGASLSSRRSRKKTDPAAEHSGVTPPGFMDIMGISGIFDDSPYGLAFVDKDLHFLRVNATFCKMLGYKKEELLRLTFRDVTHPDQAAKDVENIKKLFHGEIKYYRAEKPYLNKNGETVWGYVSVNAVRDDRGKFLYFLATIEDITHDKEMEMSLQESERRFRGLFETSLDAIVDTDLGGIIRDCNKAMAKLLGYNSPKHLIGRSFKDFTPEEYHETELKIIVYQTRVRGYSDEYEKEYIRSDGSRVPVTIRSWLKRDQDKKPVGLWTIVRDMTEKLLTRRVLIENDKRYQSLLEQTSEGMILLDEECRIIEWNPAMEKITGIPCQEVIGKFSWDVQIEMIVPDKRNPLLLEKLKRSTQEASATGLSGLFRDQREIEIANRNGESRYTLQKMFPIRTEKGYRTGTFITDITDKKMTEKAVRENEEKLRQIADNMVDMIARFDKQARFEFVSPSYGKILGYGPEDLIGKSALEFLHPDEKEKAVQSIDTMLKKGSGTVQFRFRNRNGHYLWIESTGRNLIDADGNVTGSILASRDITSRKIAQDTLRENEQKYRLLFNSGSDAVFVIELTNERLPGKILEVNEVACKRLGYTREELLKMKPRQLTEPETARDMEKNTRELFEKKDSVWEAVALAKDGRRIPVEISNHLFIIDGSAAILAISRDISDRKDAQREIERQKVFLTQIVETSPGLIFVKDNRGRYIMVNRSMADAFGLPEDEIVGKTDAQLCQVPEEAEQFRKEDQEILRTRTRMTINDDLLTYPDGSRHYFITNKIPIPDERGEVSRILGICIEITDNKKAEAALHLKDNAVESSIAAIVISDLDGKLTYTNRSFLKMWGYASSGEVLGRDFRDFTKNPEETSFLIDELKMKGTYLGMNIVKRKDGSTFYTEVAANLVNDPSGKPVNLMVSFMDITAKKNAEESLLKLSSAVDQSPLSIVITDTEGNIEYVNPYFIQLTGYSLGDVIGKNPRILKSGHTPKEEYENLWKTIRSGRVWKGEFLNKKSDGSLYWENATISPVKDWKNEITHFIGIKEDITEKKRVNDALKESEDRFRSIIENASEGIVLFDENGMIIEWNNAMEEIIGLKKEQVYGKYNWELQTQAVVQEKRTPELTARIKTAVLDALKTGKSYLFERPVEAMIQKPDGNRRYIQQRTFPIKTDKGFRIGSVTNDITDRKTAEEAVRLLNENLKSQVSAELRKNREKDHLLIQQSRLAAMGEMIHNIAHQWRQPLSAMGIYYQNFREYFHNGNLTREYVDSKTEKVIELIKYMSGTIDDFKDFFKPDKEKVPFSICQTIRKTVSIVEAGFKNNGIALVLDLDDDVETSGYPNEFAQVILNVLNNSKDALLSGKRIEPSVWIRCFHSNGKGVVTIRDNGGGIPEDTIKKVFDPYFTTKEMGSGIGLYMSKMIIEKNMNGRIALYNSGRGVEVRIEI